MQSESDAVTDSVAPIDSMNPVRSDSPPQDLGRDVSRSTALPIAPILALLAGVFSVASVGASILAVAATRELSFLQSTQVIGALALLALALLARRRSSQPLPIGRLGLWLAATALTMAGAVELPSWPSIDTFGIGVTFPFLVLLALLTYFVLERDTDGATSGMIACVIFAAFGGPLFLRDGDAFHAVHLLLAIAGVGSAELPDTPRRGTAFTRICLALIVLIAIPIASSGDRGRHLDGYARTLAALAPLALAAIAADKRRFVEKSVLALAAITAIGVLCAAGAVLEGAYHLDLHHAAQVRLPLFAEHPNIIAPFFAVTIPLVLALAFGGGSRRTSPLRSIALVALAAAALGALALTRSRAAIFGGALGVVLVLGLPLLQRLARFLATKRSKLGVAALAIAMLAGSGFVLRHKIAAKLNDPSMGFRVYMWRTAAAAIEERPLLGYGFLCADPLMNYAEEGDLDGRTKDTHPHMQPLSFALGAGIPAALVYLAVLLELVLVCVSRSLAAQDGGRFLFASLAASALALLAANLMDQGLALNTPFPLHLGILLAIAAAAAPSSSASGTPAVSLRRSLRIVLTLGLLVTALFRASDLLLQWSRVASRDREKNQAVALTKLAATLDPLSRDARLAYGDATDAAGDRAEAAEIFAKVTALLPNSPYAWEKLGNLEYDRRNYTAALQALKRAKDRDPTGPSTSQWALRIGNIYANLGMREDAIAAFAEAFRFDYEAAQRANWSQDEQKEYYIPIPGSDTPIFLAGVLKRDVDLLPDLVKTDPIKARRLATTMVRIEMSFRHFSRARDIIALYRTLTTVPWLPLEHLENDLDRIEKEEAEKAGAGEAPPESQNAPDSNDPKESHPTPPTATDAPAPPTEAKNAPDPDEFAGVAGETVIFIDRGKDLMAGNHFDEAIRSFEIGLDRSYDMVAERSYIATVIDGLFECHIRKGDLLGAKRWFGPNLYFHPKAQERFDIARRLAAAERTGQNDRAALEILTDALKIRGSLSPARSQEALNPFCATLGSLLQSTDATVRTDVEQLLNSIESDGPGLAISVLTYTQAKRLSEVPSRYQRLKRDHSDWLPVIRLPR